MGHSLVANATIECRLCRRRFDKGVPEGDPSLAGQRDDSFVCGECAIIAGGYPQDGRWNPRPEEVIQFRPDSKGVLVTPPKRSRLRQLVHLLTGK